MTLSLSRGSYAVDGFCIDVVDSIGQLPADALHLVAAHEKTCLQFGASWLLNLEQSVFGGHPGIRYLTLRQGGEPVAVLPLLVTRSRWAQRARALGNYYTCLYEPALKPGLDAQALSHLFRCVGKRGHSLSSIMLSPMDPDGPAFQTIEKALALAGFGAMRYFCFGNWYLHSAGNWPTYLASRDGKLRSTIKRMTQRIAAEGGRIEIITETGDLARGLAAYEAVYARSWKVPEPSPGFVPGLMRLCVARGALRLGLAWLHDKPIAAQLWIVAEGRAEIYKVAYDEAFKAYSPGTVLTAKLMEHVLERDAVVEVDYLVGDDPYKKNWMSHRRERWGLVAYNKHTLSGLAGLAAELSRRAVRKWLPKPSTPSG